MKILLAFVFCLISICSLAQEKKFVKPPIQQLQSIKIVATPVNGETALTSQMDAIEKQLGSIQSRQQQLQKELDAIAKQQDEMKKKMDSMSEMSETTAMRLQLYMERRQKAYEMLSNIMKKMHDTQMSIIQNLK